jgi:hypothetical protein
VARGEVIDLITLARVRGGTLRFTCFRMGCEASVDAAIDENGAFDAKLPQLRDSGYQVTLLQTPSGYGGEPIAVANGRLSRMGLRERLAMMEGGPQLHSSEDMLKGDQPSLQIALKPSRALTQDERDLLYPPAKE